MNASKFLWLSVIMLLLVPQSHLQEDPAPRPPEKYRLQLVYVFEEKTTEFVFVVGDVGFKSVDSLKTFLSTLPPGSILEWAPGCRRMGGEPLLSSLHEMEVFKAFCMERNINFILVPSG